MEFGAHAKRRARLRNAIELSDSPLALYTDAYRLQFYKVPPIEDISLEEFETLAIERLKILKAVENAGIKFQKGSKDYNDMIEAEMRRCNFDGVLPGKDDKAMEHIRKDIISHYILRLAYCRSDELRRWFIQQEVDLFRFRFGQEGREYQSKFLQENELRYTAISQEEKEQLATFLEQSNPKCSLHDDFYKVPLTEVLDLVKNRHVYLRRGMAYVPQPDMVSIVVSSFRAHLAQLLARTSRLLPHIEEDDRLLPLLSSLSKRYLGQDYSAGKTNGQITAESIDSLSVKSFPPCMRQLHEALKANHHLRHGGRMQYGLFLKGIGMSLDEALRFFRAEFIRGGTIDTDKFDKQYAYNIRHNYGKEGKRTNYTPYSCVKIITSNAPSTGDFHGCPFRHCDAAFLHQKLKSYGVNDDGIKEISQLAGNSHYQIACQKYFELTHHLARFDVGLQHPNQFFEESQKLLGGEVTSQTGTRRAAAPTSRQSDLPAADALADVAAEFNEDFGEMDTDVVMANADDL